MADISTSLKLLDAFSQPLMQINSIVAKAATGMSDLNTSLSQNISFNKMNQASQGLNQNIIQNSAQAANLNNVIENNVGTQQQLTESVNRTVNAQNNLNSAVTKSSGSALEFLGKIYLIKEGVDLISTGFEKLNKLMTFSDEINSANTRLQMVNDGTMTQIQLQQQVLDLSNRTRASYQATASMITRLGMSTQGVFKGTKDILDFTERFNKVLVASGATATESSSAILQMSQALGSGVLQGDELKSISEAAPLLLTFLSKGMGVAQGQLKKMGSDGKLTADAIVKAFANQSAEIDKMFNQMPKTFGGVMTQMKNQFADWMTSLNNANGPMAKITQQMNNILQWMQTDQGSAFFNSLGVALIAVADGFTGITNAAMGLYNFISTYSPEITAALSLMALYYIPMITTSLYGMLVPLYQAVAAWLVLNWPILIIIAAVVALLLMLRFFGVQTNEIVGFVVGLFYMFYAAIKNVFALAYNIILSFLEFLINIFIDPVYAIKKLFYDLAKAIADVFYGIVNGIIDGINKLISLINKVSGTSIEILSKFDTEGVLDAMKPVTDKNVINLDKYKMQQTGYADSFNSGYKTGFDATNKISNMLAMPNVANKNNDIANIGKVGEVGKINDKVDISSEDLKMLRDYAEMQNIQNFVNNAPAITVNTGDINNGDDMDTIVERITVALEEHISANGSGVYA